MINRKWLAGISLIILVALVFTLIPACAQPAPAPYPVFTPSPAPAPAPVPAPAPSPTAKPAPVSVQKTWQLKAHHQSPADGIHQKYGYEPWIQDVEKATNGRVKMTIYPNQTIMKQQDTWEGIKSGIADIAFQLVPWSYPGVFDLTEVTMLPFAVPNATVGSKTALALYQKFPEMQKQFADVKVLSFYTSDPYVFITTKKQIKTMEDFKGMKLRMASGPPTDMLKLLGGVPVARGMTDVYMDMQKGVLDGMAVTREAFTSFKFYEVAKYQTNVPTTVSTTCLVMNKDVWNDFPPDIQQSIMSVSGERQAIRVGTEVFERSVREALEVAKNAGYEMIIYTPPKEEVDKWVEIAGKPVEDRWVTKVEGQGYKSAREILAEMKRLVKQYSAQ